MLRLFLGFCLVLSGALSWSYEIDTQERVVAFGDVHGAYTELVQLLEEARVIDGNTDWIGGKTHLVSLGDLIDRGPGSRQVVELMMKLERQAKESGGAVHIVLGNHEVMVLTGDWRYISKPEYAAFAADETSEERTRFWNRYRRDNPDLSSKTPTAAFDDEFPPGFLALQRAYSSVGSLGAWLLQKPLLIRINDSLYTHAGLSGKVVEKSIERINRDNLKELRRYVELVDELREEGVLSPAVDFWERRLYLNEKAELALKKNPRSRPAWFEDFIGLAELESAFLFTEASPVWYRGSVYCHPFAESFNTERIFKRTDTSRLVVGHTPNPQGVMERMGGQVIRLDTGMLRSVYRGRPALMIEEQGTRYVRYLGSPDRHDILQEKRDMTPALWGISDEDMEQILLSGEVIGVEDIDTGITNPWQLTLRQGGREEYAVFKYEDTHPFLEQKLRYETHTANRSDRYQYDVAAYRLDRLIDLQMVPVTVTRKVRGKNGAVGAWIPDSINELDRSKSEAEFDSYCHQSEQYRLRFIFDILIYNEDRNLTNLIWTGENQMLHFIDHSLAFRSYAKRPSQYRKVSLRLSDLFASHLEGLSQTQLTQELGEWLHPRQIEAIIERRDLILREALRTDP